MPWSHQTFRSVLAVKLLGIMLRIRWWPTTFLTITSGDADGWCRNCPVWLAPHYGQGNLPIVFSLIDKLVTIIPPSPSILPTCEIMVVVVVLESTKVGALQCNVGSGGHESCWVLGWSCNLEKPMVNCPSNLCTKCMVPKVRTLALEVDW